jgi:hypothetical protein
MLDQNEDLLQVSQGADNVVMRQRPEISVGQCELKHLLIRRETVEEFLQVKRIAAPGTGVGELG